MYPGPAGAWARGISLEHRARRALLALGYHVCRSWGSRSAIDLTAVRAGMPPLLVQCRVGLAISPLDWQALYLAADRAGGLALVVGLDDHGGLDWRHLDAPRGDEHRRPWSAWVPA
jgi:hypothetical protein